MCEAHARATRCEGKPESQRLMEKKLHHFGHPLFTPTFNIAGAPGEEAQTRPILSSLCNIEGRGERGLYFYILPLPQVMQLFSVNSTHAPVLHGVHIAPSRLTWGPLAGDTEKTEALPLRATIATYAGSGIAWCSHCAFASYLGPSGWRH